MHIIGYKFRLGQDNKFILTENIINIVRCIASDFRKYNQGDKVFMLDRLGEIRIQRNQ